MIRSALIALVAYLLLLATVQAAPQDAVVRLPSHGGSGTVIWTEPGRTLILSCGHCFEGRQRSAPLTIECPHPTPGADVRTGGPRVLAVDHQCDLALIELRAGPLPYVAPVAPAGVRPGRLLSCGFDRMQVQQGVSRATVRPATAIGGDGDRTYTRELPYHGRSGGGLIDPDAGYLFGVCSGYSGNASPQNWAEVRPGCQGIYVSHDAVLRFLARAGQGTAPAGGPPPGPCPGGICPLPRGG